MTDETHTIGESALETPLTIDQKAMAEASISMFAGGGGKSFELIFKDGEVRGVAHGGVVIDDAARMFLDAMSHNLRPFIALESIKNSWVIREAFRPEAPTYYGRRVDNRGNDYVQWTSDPMRAMMFVRQEDAEALIRKEDWSSIPAHAVRLRDLNIVISPLPAVR